MGDRIGMDGTTIRPATRDLGDDLTALVVDAALAPGDRLPPEVEIARQLGVSRSKLREVLAGWQRMGLVTRNRGGGTVLSAPISGRTLSIPLAVTAEATSLLRTLAVRRPLEVEAVRLAARDASDADRDRIMARMLDLMAVFGAGEDWRPADHAFHAEIHAATGNPLFGQLIQQLHRAFDEVYQAPFGLPQLGSATIPLHRPLAEAVARADPQAATGIMSDILDLTESAARDVIAGLSSEGTA